MRNLRVYRMAYDGLFSRLHLGRMRAQRCSMPTFWPSAKALEQPGSFDFVIIAWVSERVIGQRRGATPL
jgi:hypothetical protein